MADVELTRRKLLERGGEAALLAAGAGWLGACGGASAPNKAEPANASGEGKPVRGGTLTVGMISGGSSETLDPGVMASWPDTLRGPALYNMLFTVANDLTLLPGLALSAESNKTATVWTLKLRDGVTWHDGKSFGADDVVAAFQGWSKPANFNYMVLNGIVDFKGVRKRGPLEVEVPLHRPIADFPTLFTTWTAEVPQAGSTAASFKTQPIGTGPFKFVSFIPGRESVFVRNPDYWESGKPYVDKLVINSSFVSESPRQDAFLSGELNALAMVPYLQAKQARQNGAMKLLVSKGGANYMIEFRVDKPPFNDVRVRQAMKLIMDRQATIDNAFAGFGRPGNNNLGSPSHKYFDAALKPEHDPEKAKALLKAAGHEGLKFTIPIAPAGAGFVEAATLFAQQAKAAGVTVNLQNIPVTNFYSPTPGNYFDRLVQLDQTPGYPSLVPYYRAYLMTGGASNASHWGGPKNDALVWAAMGETDPSRAEERWRAVQQQQYDLGGCMMYADNDFIDAVAPNVFGLRGGGGYPFNDARFQDAWIAR